MPERQSALQESPPLKATARKRSPCYGRPVALPRPLRGLAALAVAAGLLLAAPASASAFSVFADVTFDATGFSGTVSSGVTGDGSNETITITFSPGGGTTIVGTSPASARGSCRTVDANTVTCSSAPSSFTVSAFVRGGGGNDTIVVNGPSDVSSLSIFGESGNDLLRTDGLTDESPSLDGGAGDDTLVGGLGNESLRGDSGAADVGHDIMLGGGGSDSLTGLAGSDLMSGGSEGDSVSYDDGRSAKRGGVVVNLATGSCDDGGTVDQFPAGSLAQRNAPRVTLPPALEDCGNQNQVATDEIGSDIEQVRGSDFEDNLIGSARAETLIGGLDEDRVEGAGGLDQMFGSDRNDTLFGRDGARDTTMSCDGVRVTSPGADDRAVADPEDPIEPEPDCEVVERGSAGVTGPSGGGLLRPDLGFAPAPPGNPTGGKGEAKGKGGGDPDLAPQVEIVSRRAAFRRGRARVLVRCIYRAKQCVGTLRLTEDGKTVASGRVKIPWGKSKPVSVRTTRAFARDLRSSKRRRQVNARVRAKDSAGSRRAKAGIASRTLTVGRR